MATLDPYQVLDDEIEAKCCAEMNEELTKLLERWQEYFTNPLSGSQWYFASGHSGKGFSFGLSAIRNAETLVKDLKTAFEKARRRNGGRRKAGRAKLEAK